MRPAYQSRDQQSASRIVQGSIAEKLAHGFLECDRAAQNIFWKLVGPK
jgi:hypothetical protein